MPHRGGACGSNEGIGGEGAAYVFKREGNNWVEKAKLLSLEPRYNIYFGFSVALDGNYAVIGTYKGSVAYVFRREGENWVVDSKLAPSTSGYRFGYAVDICGDYIVIGAWGDNTWPNFLNRKHKASQ